MNATTPTSTLTAAFRVMPVTIALPDARGLVTAVTSRIADATRAWLDVRAVVVPFVATRSAVAAILLSAGLLGLLPGLAVPAAFPGSPRLLQPFLRYDAAHYLTIATQGYEPRHVVFFPVFPLAIRLLAPVLSAPLAAVVLAHGAFLLALALCHRLVREERGERAARRTVWAICLWPTTVFFSAGYTESLFLAIACGALLAARRERFLAAGVLAGIGCLTRITGAPLMLAVVVEALVRRGSVRARVASLVSLVPGIVLAAAFPAWQWMQYGNPMLFVSSQSSWCRSFEQPFAAIAREVAYVVANPEPVRWLIYLPTFAAIAALACLAATARSSRLSIWIYGMAAILMGVVNPVQLASRHPLVSLDRYVLVAFPALAALAMVLPGRRFPRAAGIASGTFAAAATLLYGLGAFIE